MNWQELDISISGLKKHYANNDFSPRELVAYLTELYKSEQATNENPIWIRQLGESELNEYLTQLESKSKDLPLYGVPFAIKDNIDLKKIPTTAACKAFAYEPNNSATVVKLLIEAGAIPMGKTNLDQFATGLVGTRSPFGACKNAFNEEYISGGSSSGSAVAVAKHWVSFSLGTDTAGSGRVPASLNNLIGLKPTKGLLSTAGVVPACRSLDCVSIFALDAMDANTVLDVAAKFDEQDAYSRNNAFSNGPRYFNLPSNKPVVGIPSLNQLEFFGDAESKALFDEFIKSGVFEFKEIDLQPFVEAAKLLYQGPWVTERYIAAKELVDNSPDDLLPEINTIISGGKGKSADELFLAQYQLKAYEQICHGILDTVDAIATPTNGTEYKISEVQTDPISLNSNMGYYTNFMNLIDLSAISVPVGFKSSGVGFGVTLFAKAFCDKKLLGYAAMLQNNLQLSRGINSPYKQQSATSKEASNFIEVAVCGAHLDGLPLNWQLVERGAHLVKNSFTSKNYQFFKLEGGPPFRPGLKRVGSDGESIEVEVWSVPSEVFGSFVSEIPAPLGIGKVELADGSWVTSFICEPYGLDSAEDITEFKSWRAYMRHVL